MDAGANGAAGRMRAGRNACFKDAISYSVSAASFFPLIPLAGMLSLSINILVPLLSSISISVQPLRLGASCLD